MKKRWITWLMAVVMCLSLLPVYALAEEEAEAVEEETEIAEIEEAAEETAEPQEDGDGAPAIEWQKGDADLVIEAADPIVSLRINGIVFSSEYYSLDESGTVLTISAGLLNAWGNGTYRFTLEYSDVSEEILVTISGEAPVTPTPGQTEIPVEGVANGVCGDNLTWKITADGVVTISGTGDMWDLKEWWYEDDDKPTWAWSGLSANTITKIVIEDGVTSIADRTFDASNFENVTEVSIAGTVTTIGRHAFSGCYGLMHVDIPEGVTTIMDSAFESVESVSLPASLRVVGERAFNNYSLREATYAGTASQLDEIQFGEECETLIRLMRGYSFEDCGDHVKWSIENGTLTIYGTGDMWDYSRAPRPWEESDEGYTRIVFEEGVTGIGAGAFSEVSAQIIGFPASLERIGDYNFAYISEDTEILYAGTDEQRAAITFGDDSYDLQVRLLGYAVGKVGSNVTWKLTQERDLIILGTGVMSDYSEIFERGYANLSVYLFSVPWQPEGRGWPASNTVTIENGVTSIMHCAFTHSRMTEITIPASITSVGDWAFFDCDNLKTIIFEGDAPTFEIMLVTPSPESGFVPASAESEAFIGVTATAYYPANNPTWTEAVRQNYGGNITWVAYDTEEPEPSVAAAAGYLAKGETLKAVQALQTLVGLGG